MEEIDKMIMSIVVMIMMIANGLRQTAQTIS